MKVFISCVYLGINNVIYYAYSNEWSMTNQAKVKLYAVQSRHTINLPAEFVRDSAFPFNVGEELIARIEDDKVVIEKKKSPLI